MNSNEKIPLSQTKGALADKNFPAGPGQLGPILGLSIFLAVMVWMVFGQTRKFDFVNFDDGQYITDNASVTAGVTADGVASAFNPHTTDNWVPLTTISHMVDCQFYGVNAGGHHLTNVLLHLIAVILLLLTLFRMTGMLWRSALVAAVFAVHPLRAESVAWVSERKDVLCGVFFMLTLWTYAGYARNPKSWSRYLAVLFFAALALMAKPVAVTLPFVLLLLDYWPLNRFASDSSGKNSSPSQIVRLIVEKIPFLMLSIAACLPTILTEKQGITMTTVVPIHLRIENAIVSTVVYIQELFYPSQLAAFYYYPILGLPFWEVALALIFLTAVSLAALYYRRTHPYILAGWLWYLVMLVPVIGFVQVGSQAHADRHTYLSEIGLGLLLIWLAADLFARFRRGRLILVTASIAVVVILTLCGHRQVSSWENGGTLWSHALKCDPNDVRAYYDLANYLEQKNELDASITNYEMAIKIDPQLVGAHNNLGMVLAARGDLDNAIKQYQQAIQLDTNYAVAHYNLGSVLLQKGADDEAILEFQKALNIDPAHSEVRNNPDLALPDVTASRLKNNYAEFHYALALALEKEGRSEEAIAQYRETLQLNPNYAGAGYGLAQDLLKNGQVDEGLAQYGEALKLNPDDAKAHNNFGIALRKAGRLDDAIAQYQDALKINPGYAQAHYNLGNVWFQKRQINDAILQYQEALKAMPDNLMLQKNLAHTIWLLATSPDASQRNGTNAVALAEAENKLLGESNPITGRVLAAAYAESGNFPKAIETGNQAMARAAQQQNQPLQSALQQEISLYQEGKAMRAGQDDTNGW